MIESFEFSSVAANSRTPAHVSAKFGITIYPDGSGNLIGRFDNLATALKRQEWTTGEPQIPTTESIGNEGAKTGVAKVLILTEQPKIEEAGK
jgi:hypothetical protein